jgi:NADH-quinone oxidoreductase subunit J
MTEIMHIFFNLLLIKFSLCIFLFSNPVHAAFCLILCFCTAAIILLILEVEFLGLLFIMVYVGAIAVLFLFVIMMINTKKQAYTKYFWVIYYVFSIFSLPSYYYLFYFFDNWVFDEYGEDSIKHDFNSSVLIFDNLHNIQVIGQTLFNQYNIIVVFSGLILLVALIGGVSLTKVSLPVKLSNDNNSKPLSRVKNSTHKFS